MIIQWFRTPDLKFRALMKKLHRDEGGNIIVLYIAASLLHDEYVWSWNTRIRSGRTGEPKAAFSQSTFLGTPLSLETLKKQRM